MLLVVSAKALAAAVIVYWPGGRRTEKFASECVSVVKFFSLLALVTDTAILPSSSPCGVRTTPSIRTVGAACPIGTGFCAPERKVTAEHNNRRNIARM